MKRNLDMDLEFLPYLVSPPVSPQQLHKQAISNDTQTIDAWRTTWIENAKINHEKHGPFVENHIGQQFDLFRNQPAIILGSGPSLKNSIKALKKNKTIPVVSCLHNFHYMIDHKIKVDLWVSLDCGKVTIEEISEGGKKPPEYYLEKTKGQKLAAFISSDPGLIDSWQGDISWFSCGIPDNEIRQKYAEIEPFEIYVSTGGNVLGSAMYIAKAIWGCNPIAMTGADFCFDYMKKFHPWDSKYDGKLGKALFTNDVFGNKVYTWQSYHNFKSHFDAVSIKCPGIWVNISEGGTWGAYPEGIIPSVRQMAADDFVKMYHVSEEIKYMCENPKNATEPGLSAPKILF
jgi:hypothetical protein